MARQLSFVLSLTPVPKARPRARVIYKNGKPVPHIYTPEDTLGFEDAVRRKARELIGTEPALIGPVSVRVMLTMPITKSWPRWRRDAARRGVLYPDAKPDIDNLAKSVLDACNGVLWVDDGQITDLILTKRYGVEPGIKVVAAGIDLAEAAQHQSGAAPAEEPDRYAGGGVPAQGDIPAPEWPHNDDAWLEALESGAAP